MQETRNINSNVQNTTELWSNTFLTEIKVSLFVSIKLCDFHLYSHCQGQTFPLSVIIIIIIFIICNWVITWWQYTITHNNTENNTNKKTGKSAGRLKMRVIP
jgi:membrane protein YdbS with pleckstrin-like domain